MITRQMIPQFHKTDRILYCGEEFMYLLPHAALRRWVSNYTVTFPHKGMISEQYTIMPHGCTTLVFTGNTREINSTLFGTITKPVMVGRKINAPVLLFIIEFQPAGFYDIPHMTHELKSTCGITPMDFRKNMSDFYNEIAKY